MNAEVFSQVIGELSAPLERQSAYAEGAWLGTASFVSRDTLRHVLNSNNTQHLITAVFRMSNQPTLRKSSSLARDWVADRNAASLFLDTMTGCSNTKGAKNRIRPSTCTISMTDVILEYPTISMTDDCRHLLRCDDSSPLLSHNSEADAKHYSGNSVQADS